MPDLIRGGLKQPFQQQVAFFRNKLGNLIPTERWDDLVRAQHDVGFMVAGAQKSDLLADLALAVDKAITEGEGIDAFRKRFDELVKRNGWTGWTGESSKPGRAWRTSIIYKTNMRTSYAAGRLAQLREAKFEYWMYKHNDTVLHPRQHHLQLDGIIRPATDAFWQKYFAPNGWGCRCRIVGVSDPERARSLGGDPDKELPDWVNKTDPKTGAATGIDKGFDYMPGDTVSDTVRQMASKTIQWDYTLAKAYMQSVPASVRDKLAIAVRSQPETGEVVRRYASRILEDRTELEIPKYQTLGLLTQKDVARVAEAKDGLKVSDFDFTLNPSSVKHVRSGHGHQVAGHALIDAQSYARLPEILNAPDVIEDAGKSRRTGLPLVRYSKRYGREEWIVIFEVRNGRKMLALSSFYIPIRKE